MSSIKANDSTFKGEVLNQSQPVLVDFWAPWCGPCRAMSGVVEELASDLEGQAKVVKVNVDESPEAATSYGIQSIPAFAVFEGGQLKRSAVGVLPKQALIDLIQSAA
jgi:thioredoxin 1